MGGFFQDVRYGVRAMLRQRSLTFIAIVALALGIGANTTIFSVVDALLLRPMPGLGEPDRLFVAGRTNEGSGFDSLSYPDYRDYRDQSKTIEGLAAFFRTSMHLSDDADYLPAERIQGALVTGNYFSLLGVNAIAGRLLLPEDDASPGASPVIVISSSLWKRAFGADPEVMGKSVSINSRSYSIVGVAAEGFKGTELYETIEIWAPLSRYREIEPMAAQTGEDFYANREIVWLNAFGRLAPGSTVEQAQAEMTAIAARIEESFPKRTGVGLALSPQVGLDPEERLEVGSFAALLMATVVLVLLIACANVANLLLARATARETEIGVRLALGASRGRLVRQLLTESLMLAVAGAAAGLFVSLWLNDLLLAFLPKTFLGIPLRFDLEFNWRVLGFSAGCSVLTGIIFGLAPALSASRPDLVSALKGGAQSSTKRTQVRLRGALVAGQVALSIVLLIGAGLFVKTMRRAYAIDLGFDPRQVLIAELDLNRHRYSRQQSEIFYRSLLGRVRSLAGVESASYASIVPLAGLTSGTTVRAEGRGEPDSSDDQLQVDTNQITPGYFDTMRLPLVRGRDFDERDNAQAPGVVIINQTLANRLWPGEDALGKRLASWRAGGRAGGKWPMLQVIGIAADARYRSPLETTTPLMYQPSAQGDDPWRALHIRASGDPSGLVESIQAEVHSLNRRLPVFNVRPLKEELDGALTPQLVAARFIGLFGLLALVLAVIGLFGVMSYSTAQRTREIGIRMALGADRKQVFEMVISQGLMLTIAGIAAGLAVSFGVTRLLSSLLYGVEATDTATFALTAMLLLAAALVACWVPARRATKVDPIVALRNE
jgi:predicted permease